MFFALTSYTIPRTVYRLNLETYETTPFWEPLGWKHDLSHIKTDYVWYDSFDGTKVPLTILRNSKTFPSLDHKPEAPIPTSLYVYGGFANVESPFFQADYIVWLENFHGMVAISHIRGGGELGASWHLQAHGSNRTTGIKDLAAAAEYLQKKGYTDS
jgi:prolyl oligopeptidase